MPECSQKWKEFQVSPVFSQVYCYLCAWKGESTLVFPPPRKCRFVKAKRLCKRLVWKVQIQGRKKKKMRANCSLEKIMTRVDLGRERGTTEDAQQS